VEGNDMLPIILVVLGMLCIVSSFGFEGTSNTLFSILGVFLVGAAVILIIINVPGANSVHKPEKITHFGGIPIERFKGNDKSK
jgi:uncharacterized membrane protein YkvI